MNDQDYIRKAVELADGYAATEKYWYGPWYGPSDGYFDYDLEPTGKRVQPALDALAAQLVRQVDAIAPSVAFSCGFQGEVFMYEENTDKEWDAGYGVRDEVGDRTMNTIKAIVDSGVLS